MFDLTQTCELNLKAEFHKEARVAAGSPVVEVSESLLQQWSCWRKVVVTCRQCCHCYPTTSQGFHHCYISLSLHISEPTTCAVWFNYDCIAALGHFLITNVSGRKSFKEMTRYERMFHVFWNIHNAMWSFLNIQAKLWMMILVVGTTAVEQFVVWYCSNLHFPES